MPGVDTCNVHRLNILQLAPGGHLGRFLIFTKDAFKALNVTGPGGGAGEIAGITFAAPSVKGAGGEAGGIAGEAFKAPNIKGAGGGAGGIAGDVFKAPNMKGD